VDSPVLLKPGVSFKATLVVHPVVEHTNDKDV
jgi:hypothetical protein